MASVKPSSRFREWLSDALEQSGHSKREVARRMASRHPRGVTHDTIETARRTLNKILSGDLTPTQPTRDTIQDALERSDAPSVDDEEESDMEATLQAATRELATVSKRLRRIEKAVRS